MFRLSLVFALLLASCSPPLSGPEPLTVMSHDSFAVTDTVIHDFETRNNAKVIFIKSGDAGAALNKAILTKGAPLADVFFGVDNTFLSRALGADIFEAYDSPLLASIPAAFRLDSTQHALPVDYGDVCINYDKAFFASKGLTVPRDLEDLEKSEYMGLLVTENPASSSPGLAFLLATVKHFGDPGYLTYWSALRQNGLVVADGWETAYYTNFSGSSGRGPQPMVVSYGSSPAAEVMFSSQPLTDSPTASIIGPDTCFRQIEFVGLLKGTAHRALARKFVDFMLSAEFQADMPAQMFVYPVVLGIGLPDAFIKYSQLPSQPATLAPDRIAEGRDAWIEAWTNVVLH
jgi:thiamine transport system substrate-binding protein